MQPTLKQLRYYLALVEAGHFGRAAKACHVTQSTLSAAIQELEEGLGLRLVERSRRRVMVTAAGQEVAARARRILAEVEDLAAAASRARAPFSGPLHLGVIPTVGPYLLPRLLPALRQRFPGLKLFLREDQTARLLERLGAGGLDLLLLALPVEAPETTAFPLFEDPFLLVCAADHPLAAKRVIRRRDLAGQPLLLLEDGHCLRDQALDVCRLAGDGAAEVFAATSLNTLVQMVANGLGVTLLPTLSLEVELRGEAGRVVTRPFAPPPPARRIGLVWRRTAGRGEEFARLGRLLRELCPPSP